MSQVGGGKFLQDSVWREWRETVNDGLLIMEWRDGGKGRVRNLIRHEKELKGKQGSVNKLECVFVRESMSYVVLSIYTLWERKKINESNKICQKHVTAWGENKTTHETDELLQISLLFFFFLPITLSGETILNVDKHSTVLVSFIIVQHIAIFLTLGCLFSFTFFY